MSRFKTRHLLLTIGVIVFCSCATTKSIPQGIVINHSNIEEYLKRGDKVKVTTIDGTVYRFNILSIEDIFLVGNRNSELIKVPYSLIEDIENTKSKLTFVGGILVALLVASNIIGFAYASF